MKLVKTERNGQAAQGVVETEKFHLIGGLWAVGRLSIDL
jgi:hypothetical protein